MSSKYHYWDETIRMLKANNLPEGHEFDMGIWGETRECGTAACLAGTAYFLEHNLLTEIAVYPEIENLFDLLLIDLCWWANASTKSVIERYERIQWARDQQIKGADLSNLDLTGANLTGLDLSECDLRDTNLIGAQIDDCNLHGAIYNKYTLFSIDFDPEKAGMIEADEYDYYPV